MRSGYALLWTPNSFSALQIGAAVVKSRSTGAVRYSTDRQREAAIDRCCMLH